MSKMANITRLSVIKFLELVFVCLIIVLHCYSHNMGEKYALMITIGTMGGYLIILVGLFAGDLMGHPVNRRVDLFFSVVGFALFLTSGALFIDMFHNLKHRDSFRHTGLAKGSMCIFEAAFFLIDVVLTFRGGA